MEAIEAHTLTEPELTALAVQIRGWAGELGFGRVGITDIDLTVAHAHLVEWLEKGFHGELHYMARHGALRANPALLVPGTLRVLSVGMDYLPESTRDSGWVKTAWGRLGDAAAANISLYAVGRDYHKVVRQRLQRLAARIGLAVGPLGYRVFTDSAPVLEVELARKAGLGWRGKHTLLLSRQGGSMFFLGEIFLDLPLPLDAPAKDHCGRCTRCIDICPTAAIVAPYQLDARRCISYLTIELHGSIPEEFRPLIGNRVYGCDDCQLACPWNKFAEPTRVDDFHSRGLDDLALQEAFRWDEATFLERTQGSPIRRIGHERWLRNVAVALGNALAVAASHAVQGTLRAVLRERLNHPSELVREHVLWALEQRPSLPNRSGSAGEDEPDRQRHNRQERSG